MKDMPESVRLALQLNKLDRRYKDQRAEYERIKTLMHEAQHRELVEKRTKGE